MYLNSRYATGTIPSPPYPNLRVEGSTTPGPDIVIRRPYGKSNNVLYYWQDGDRWDRLAEYFGLPRTSWHLILDANPHLENPIDISPGTRIWLPVEARRQK